MTKYRDTPAPRGREAIYEAGQSVNANDLESTDQIRPAVTIASSAANRVKSTSESTNRQMGRYTGMRIAKFQNWLYEQNRIWHFTDGTLCVLWKAEYPVAKSDFPAHPDYIASTRTDYNAGRHQAPAPGTLCCGYDKDGRELARSSSPWQKGLFVNRGSCVRLDLSPVSPTTNPAHLGPPGAQDRFTRS